MKGSGINRFAPVFVSLVMASLGGSVYAQTAGPACVDIDTHARQVLYLDTLTAQGDIVSGPLQGSFVLMGDMSSLARLESEFAPPSEVETYSFSGNLQITTATGTLDLRASGVLERVPAGRGTLIARTTSGSGNFSGMTGTLFVNFTAGEQNILDTAITGQLCEGGPVIEPPAPVTPPPATTPPAFHPPRLTI